MWVYFCHRPVAWRRAILSSRASIAIGTVDRYRYRYRSIACGFETPSRSRSHRRIDRTHPSIFIHPSHRCRSRARRRRRRRHICTPRISLKMSALLASSFVSRVAAFKATKIQVRIVACRTSSRRRVESRRRIATSRLRGAPSGARLDCGDTRARADGRETRRTRANVHGCG